MFYYCSSLKTLNLSSFNTSNVTDMSKMFNECSSLEELNISYFNTSNVTKKGGMFYECPDELTEKTKEKIQPQRLVRLYNRSY